MKFKRLLWVGNVAWVLETNNTNIILVGKRLIEFDYEEREGNKTITLSWNYQDSEGWRWKVLSVRRNRAKRLISIVAVLNLHFLP
jgi:hypothetical protein